MSKSEETSFLGKGRLFDALVAAVVLSAGAAVAAYAISQTCFHNTAGSREAFGSRGEWCGTLASGSGWEIKLIAVSCALAAVVAVLPGPRWVRGSVLILAALAMLLVPLYMGTLDYSSGV